MSVSDQAALPTIAEGLFYQLLDGPGMVHVDIVRLGRYFAPFVTALADDSTQTVQYGAIVRGKSDLLAAESVEELCHLLRDIADGSTRLKIHVDELDDEDGLPH